ncbi:MAG: disulfide bond formation protein B [Candidatus Falkowbacteria bacterium]
MINVINSALAALTVFGQALLVAGLIYLFLSRGRKDENFRRVLGSYFPVLGLAVVLAATAGSLYYSEIAGYNPCKLCWYQRIFMYPLVPIFGLALFKKDRRTADYVLALAAIGALISLYHNYIYYFGSAANACSAVGPDESCVRRFIVAFGYVSIPLEALTAFALIIALALAGQRYRPDGK